MYDCHVLLIITKLTKNYCKISFCYMTVGTMTLSYNCNIFVTGYPNQAPPPPQYTPSAQPAPQYGYPPNQPGYAHFQPGYPPAQGYSQHSQAVVVVQSAPGNREPINYYMIWSILNCIFCCWILGIAAIVMSLQAKSQHKAGEYCECGNLTQVSFSYRDECVWVLICWIFATSGWQFCSSKVINLVHKYSPLIGGIISAECC